MPRALPHPIIYLITSGETTDATTAGGADFRRLLSLVERAVAARVAFVQLREKSLTARTLYDLAAGAAALARGSATRILVNDRADIARAAGCDGVHLTTRSLDASVVRRAFGEDFLIGVSAHSLAEAGAARDGGADFAVFGPVFDTPSKRPYGPPLGLEALRDAAHALSPFPLVALGGIVEGCVGEVRRAGAAGVAGIGLFGAGQNFARTVHHIESLYAA
ncbi:MAG: thiamine-phosphate pyrophosphorylase [Acidobacteriota bacterium]|jgi:thiamine-phosphate pyrophosphorylase|nr:thiamine-phosphate pyrophosphorylase [Acidobacteriota bacterium]